jgi:tryptophanase
MKVRTIIEPFRMHSVQRIPSPTIEEREAALERAGFNLFGLHGDEVIIDLLTDSGTGAMSSQQWAGVLDGDESYAGSRSFYRFQDVVRDLTGFSEVIPTHQGRAAERILFATMVGKGQMVPNNTHFDTTRANVEFQGAEAIDLPCAEAAEPGKVAPFKGNIDVKALARRLEEAGPGRVPVAMVTVTNNSSGGQPVSMANLRDVRAVCDRFEVPLFLDACRFAENAYFIKLREPGYADRTPLEISREMFSLADGCTFSAKKDGLANIGGFLAMNDPELAQRCRNLLILTEGFPTYGGLAGYDLEAIAIGLTEVVSEEYLRYRIRSTAYLADVLHEGGVPIMRPAGGHAVYIDAKALMPHVPPWQYPAQSLAIEIYREGGVRSCEIGTVMFGRHQEGGHDLTARSELVRMAIPRRTYTQSHIDYVGEIILGVAARAAELPGYRIVEQQQWLRHFTARFEPLSGAGAGGSS